MALLVFVMPQWSGSTTMNRFTFHPGGWQEGSLLALYGALLRMALSKEDGTRSEAARLVLGAQGIMWAAILISSAPREDMASRIFLPAAAPLIGLVLLSVQRNAELLSALGVSGFWRDHRCFSWELTPSIP